MTEERIHYLEDKLIEIIQSDKQKEKKRIKKNEPVWHHRAHQHTYNGSLRGYELHIGENQGNSHLSTLLSNSSKAERIWKLKND